MNKTILMGRLVKDPDVSVSASGTSIAKFSIAVDRKFKREGDPDADFFNCVSFAKQAQFVENYLHKGTKVVVTGRIENNNYTNKEGRKVYEVRIMVEEIEFAESKSEGKSESKEEKKNDFLNLPEGLTEELPFA